jgi:hypothetical protein
MSSRLAVALGGPWGAASGQDFRFRLQGAVRPRSGKPVCGGEARTGGEDVAASRPPVASVQTVINE